MMESIANHDGICHARARVRLAENAPCGRGASVRGASFARSGAPAAAAQEPSADMAGEDTQHGMFCFAGSVEPIGSRATGSAPISDSSTSPRAHAAMKAASFAGLDLRELHLHGTMRGAERLTLFFG